MKKNIVFIILIVVLMMSCSTTQNSVTNNNTPTAAPQNQVPAPVKRSNKYQKNKNGDQLMTAPTAVEKVNERVESAGTVRDTL